VHRLALCRGKGIDGQKADPTKCGGKLAEKRARKGGRTFYGCTNYPNCDFTTWTRPIPMACPTGDGGLMVEAGKGKAKCLHCEQTFEIPQEGDVAQISAS
jgi:DNA topoisomerase-1